MKCLRTITMALLLLLLTQLAACAQYAESDAGFAEGAGIEWDILNQEVMELQFTPGSPIGRFGNLGSRSRLLT